MAKFTNEACESGGVSPTDQLTFNCNVDGAVILRIVFPTGDQEIISLGDTTDDVVLPPGFTAVSLDITEIDVSRRNFSLTLSIDHAFYLKGGSITCDDSTSRKIAMAGCQIGKFSLSICSLICYLAGESVINEQTGYNMNKLL